jgi:hypothetical protein
VVNNGLDQIEVTIVGENLVQVIFSDEVIIKGTNDDREVITWAQSSISIFINSSAEYYPTPLF